MTIVGKTIFTDELCNSNSATSHISYLRRTLLKIYLNMAVFCFIRSCSNMATQLHFFIISKIT